MSSTDLDNTGISSRDTAMKGSTKQPDGLSPDLRSLTIQDSSFVQDDSERSEDFCLKDDFNALTNPAWSAVEERYSLVQAPELSRMYGVAIAFVNAKTEKDDQKQENSEATPPLTVTCTVISKSSLPDGTWSEGEFNADDPRNFQKQISLEDLNNSSIEVFIQLVKVLSSVVLDQKACFERTETEYKPVQLILGTSASDSIDKSIVSVLRNLFFGVGVAKELDPEFASKKLMQRFADHPRYPELIRSYLKLSTILPYCRLDWGCYSGGNVGARLIGGALQDAETSLDQTRTVESLYEEAFAGSLDKYFGRDKGEVSTINTRLKLLRNVMEQGDEASKAIALEELVAHAAEFSRLYTLRRYDPDLGVTRSSRTIVEILARSLRARAPSLSREILQDDREVALSLGSLYYELFSGIGEGQIDSIKYHETQVFPRFFSTLISHHDHTRFPGIQKLYPIFYFIDWHPDIKRAFEIGLRTNSGCNTDFTIKSPASDPSRPFADVVNLFMNDHLRVMTGRALPEEILLDQAAGWRESAVAACNSIYSICSSSAVKDI